MALRRVIGKLFGWTLRTPAKIEDGCYLVPSTICYELNGETRREIKARNVILALIADKLGTDSPQAVMLEYHRCCFVSHVRQKCAEQELLQVVECAEKNAMRTQSGVNSEFESEVKAEPEPNAAGASAMATIPTATEESRVTALSTETDLQTRPLHGDIILFPDKKSDSGQATQETKTAQQILNDALLGVKSGLKRRQINEYLESHPELGARIVDEKFVVTIGFDKTSRVRVRCQRRSETD